MGATPATGGGNVATQWGTNAKEAIAAHVGKGAHKSKQLYSKGEMEHETNCVIVEKGRKTRNMKTENRRRERNEEVRRMKVKWRRNWATRGRNKDRRKEGKKVKARGAPPQLGVVHVVENVFHSQHAEVFFFGEGEGT